MQQNMWYNMGRTKCQKKPSDGSRRFETLVVKPETVLGGWNICLEDHLDSTNLVRKKDLTGFTEELVFVDGS